VKIFIYHDLILSNEIWQKNLFYAELNRLYPHLQYLVDFYIFFKKYETKNPDEADFFFVPIFTAGLQFANVDPELLINHCAYLHRGRHILVSTGDVGQRAESKYEMTHEANPLRAYDKKYSWMDDRFILIVLESLASLHRQDIAILPYRNEPIKNQSIERDILLSFMGSITQLHLPPDHIRGGRLLEFKKRFESDKVVIGTPIEVKQKLGEISYHDLMARSIFTLCPAGYGRWSFRFVEALLNGSIPILVSDEYVLPFADKIDWNKYCYVTEERHLFSLTDFIQRLFINEINEKQKSIAKDRHIFEKEFTMEKVAENLESQSYADIAIGKMRSPEHMHIICVDVTNKCDLACSNCTRLLKNQDSLWEMTPENFRLALRSLKDFKGIIAMIGGNPCVHTQFERLCEVFCEEIPNQHQRGLWTNNYFKHREVIEKTFGGLNLNPHNEERANEKLKDLHNVMVNQRGFNGGYYAGNSRHAPLLTAVKDLYPEKEMWEKIAGCDVNREWSASIVQNNGNLRAYFCEVAASFDLARGTDNGHPVVEGWWKRPIREFEGQIKHFCTGCGVPARLRGSMDNEQIDTYTKSNADLALKSAQQKGRKIKLLDSDEALDHKVTEYFSG
jgi:organic radical activating enzyme